MNCKFQEKKMLQYKKMLKYDRNVMDDAWMHGWIFLNLFSLPLYSL